MINQIILVGRLTGDPEIEEYEVLLSEVHRI